MTAVNLESVRGPVEVLRYCKARKAELKTLEEAAREQVEAVMGDADEGLLDNEPAIRWPTYKKRQLDQKALHEDHPELAESYTKFVEQRTFTIVDK